MSGPPFHHAVMEPVISLRPIIPADEELLFRIYASTREEELKVLNWSSAEKETFLRQQFNAQHRHYQQAYPGAQFSVLAMAGEDIGRLYVWRGPAELRILDIALLPAWRGRGLGSRLLRELLDEAAASHRRVTLHVEVNSPALRLYQRLGFRPISTNGIYCLMEAGKGFPSSG